MNAAPPRQVVVFVCKCGCYSTARADLARCYGPSQRQPENHAVRAYTYDLREEDQCQTSASPSS